MTDEHLASSISWPLLVGAGAAIVTLDGDFAAASKERTDALLAEGQKMVEEQVADRLQEEMNRSMSLPEIPKGEAPWPNGNE